MILRIVAALVIVVIAGWLFSVLFDFLRSRDANRFLVVLVAIGDRRRRRLLPVLGDEQGRRLAAGAVSARACGPTSSSGPPLVILSVFLVYPVINTILISFKDARGQSFVGLDNYKFVFTDPSMLRSIRNTVGWIVLVPLVAVTHRPRVRDARRPAPSRRGDRQVADLPADGDLVRRARRSRSG